MHKNKTQQIFEISNHRTHSNTMKHLKTIDDNNARRTSNKNSLYTQDISKNNEKDACQKDKQTEP